MSKWLLIAIIFLGCFLIFSTDEGCSSYYPYLYKANHDILTSSFILVNNSGCGQQEREALMSYLSSQRPEMILTLRSPSPQAFEFNETLSNSLVVCEGTVSKIKATEIIKRLSSLGFDASGIPNQVYINFFDGAYNSILVVSCGSYQDYDDYRGRIVIVGEMGSSDLRPVYDSHDSAYRVPYHYQGKDSIYSTQLLAIILSALVSKQIIIDMPLQITIPVFLGVVFLLCIFAEYIQKKHNMLLIKVFLFKLFQVLVALLVFASLVFVSRMFNYVCDFKLFIASIVVGGELCFWMLYLFNRMSARYR